MTDLPPPDDLAIRALYAGYNHAIHRGDSEAWAACFTSDGRFSNRATTVSGRAELLKYALGWIGSGNSRYWIDNVILEATPEGATGMCYLLLIHVSEGDTPARVDLSGIYTDTLVRVAGGWKFATRHISRDE